MRRSLSTALASGLALGVAACDYTRPSTAVSPSAAAPIASTMPTDIGEPLYPPVTPKPRPIVPVAAADPIILRNCQVTLPETQNAPSKNDGKLLAFCTEILPNEAAPPPDQIVVHPITGKKYRKLREGDFVKQNQLIALLDDKEPRAKQAVAGAKLEANVAKKVAADKLRDLSLAELDSQKQLMTSNATTKFELRRAQAQFDKSIADQAEAEGSIRMSQEEVKMSLVVLEEHEIRSSINGQLKRFYRKPGEAVKALEPIAEIQNIDLFRVEGLIDYQYLASVQGQKSVNVEPAIQVNYKNSLLGHLQAVRAVAVSRDTRKPLIVSASDDKTARVWDRSTGVQQALWIHPVPVRAVACTGAGADANLCVTGADDGVPRLFNLDTLGGYYTETEKPRAELKGRHSGPITCAAFAPNGKTFATADAKEIMLWDVATGEVKYKFPAFHKGPITYVQFTPQCMLVSEARDNTLGVWKLGDKGAVVEHVVEHRSGRVSVLGVNADGTRVLFDQENALHVLTIEQRTEGVLPAPSEATQFTGFALFSPDDRLVLAAGTNDSPLQLWKAPQPGQRASLFRRLAVPPGGHATCAAFAPDGSFAVTGTQDNKVLIWAMPSKVETDRELTAAVVLQDQTIDTDRKARIWAELPRPDGISLRAGDTATMVIQPAEGK